jgi:small subunit ribosomal protein S16
MLAIRLSRTGKKHQAYFRIVVSDSRRTPTAKFIEILGNYDPHAKKLQIDKEKLEKYLKNGAQPSNSVAKLLKNEKIALPKWVKIEERNRAPKKAVEEKPAAAPKSAPSEAEGSEEAATEAPAEESAPAEATEEVKTEEVKDEAPAPEAEKPAEEVPADKPETEDAAK